MNDSPVAKLEQALNQWRIFDDAPATRELAQALEDYVTERIRVMHITSPYIGGDLTDADYETLLKGANHLEFIPVGRPTPIYLGQKRLTCAACGGLMVDGLCSIDAGHWQ